MRLSAGSFICPVPPVVRPPVGPWPPADTAGPDMKAPPCACAAASVLLDTWASADIRDACTHRASKEIHPVSRVHMCGSVSTTGQACLTGTACLDVCAGGVM